MTASSNNESESEPFKAALAIRERARDLWERLNRHPAGTPRTGAVHRGVTLRVKARHDVRADIVEPIGAGPHPVLIYAHGGGWVAGDLDTYFQLVRRFAEQGFVVVCIDYRLAPENPFPAGYDDIASAVIWAQENISTYNGDPDRIAIAGDSAGANLAAAVAVSEPDLSIRAAGLIYGTYDFATMGPNATAADLLLRAYIGAAGDTALALDSRLSPIHAADKMPPAFILVGSTDEPSRISQAGDLADKMAKAGLAHAHVLVEDHEHGFMQKESLPETLPMFAKIATFLQAHMPKSTE